MVSNRALVNAPEDLSFGQELVFAGINRMCLNFNHELVPQRENSLQAHLRFKRHEREEEVGKRVTPSQHMIHGSTVKPVDTILLHSVE